MNFATGLLGPVIALVAWSMVMWVWMYATRIPAMIAAKIWPNPYQPFNEQMARLPPKVRWKADNFNHLMEQPTVFYAITITLAMLPVNTALCIALAWSYVALRIAHSLVQALVNKIAIRFLLFVLSNLVLAALTYIAAMAYLPTIFGS